MSKKNAKHSPLIQARFLALLLFAIVLAAAVSFGNLLFSSRPKADLVTSNDFVKTVDSFLIYKNQPMRLQGVNVNNQPWDNNWKGSVNSVQTTEVDYQKLSELGGNHFRFGITYGMWKYDQAKFYQMLDQQIVWAKKYGIWLMPVAFTTPGDCSSSGWGDPCNMRGDAAKQTELIAMWKDIAGRYKNEPAIVGYDLLNEPGYSYSWFFNWAQKARDEISAVDPHHLIFVTAGSDSLFPKKLTGNNIVYQVHDYVPMALSHCGDSNYSQPPLPSAWRYTYPGNAPDYDGTQVYWSKEAFSGNGHARANLKERLAINWAKNNNVHLYIGEWGGETCFTGLNRYITDHGELFSDWGVSHAHFVWKNTKGRWGIFPNGSSLVPYDQTYLDAIRISWQGAVKLTADVTTSPPPVPSPNASASPAPSPTAGPATPTPVPSPVILPSPSPTSTEVLRVTSPLLLSANSAKEGEVLTAKITYKNISSQRVTISRFVIAARTPGGTNLEGPYMDFSPQTTSVVLNPGQERTIQASRQFTKTDPSGIWYAYGTYQHNGRWIDTAASQNVQFSVNQVQVDPLKILKTNNKSVTFEEVKARSGNTVYLKTNISSTKKVQYVNWHVWPNLTPRYVGTESSAPYYLGGINRDNTPKGYTLPSIPLRMNVWIKFTDGSSFSAYGSYQ